MLYILDEPSIGLHQRDNEKLLKTLLELRDLGNTLIVVEHDEDTMRAADYIVDIGPRAGRARRGSGRVRQRAGYHGRAPLDHGRLILPGDAGSRSRPRGGSRTGGSSRWNGCRQNNLRGIDVRIPVGLITAVTGVSGSGKSSLVNEIVYPLLANELNGAHLVQGKCDGCRGLEHFDKVIAIDQSPIGRTPRSNPATYRACSR